MLIWVVEKKVVRHLIEQRGQLAEVPVRVSFEYAVDDRTVVDGSLSLRILYNKAAILRHFPELDDTWVQNAVQATADHAIDEHLAMSGFVRH